MCKNVALEAGPLAGLQKLVHLNKQENLRTSHLEAHCFNAGEGQSATFCRESTQIYRTLFVSN